MQKADNKKNKKRDDKKIFKLNIYLLVLTIVSTILIYSFLQIDILYSYLISINTVTFFTFAYDKFIAGSNHFRVPENTTFLLSILGGSPAILLGIHFLRHKSRKADFQLMVVGILLVQIMLVIYLRKIL